VATRRLIIEMRFTDDLASMAMEAKRDPSVQPDIAVLPEFTGVTYDEEFPPTALPGRQSWLRAESIYESAPFDLVAEPEASTYVVRAEADENQIDNIKAQEDVVGVFSDPIIEPFQVCSGSPAVGSDADVERLLCAAAMRQNGMDGLGVLVAIVDTGINMAYLNSRGKTPNFDAARSWVPQSGLMPGDLPVDHGTMCAFDACIAAPECTLLDIAVLQSTAPGLQGLLSDAIRAYSHLLDIMIAPKRPGESRSLIVNNSWGMYHPSWDFPPEHSGNYSDNPNHPFNRIVGDLERAGADILFAAGNCGADCPDGRCQGVTNNAIYGANSHPSVLSVAGVDTTKTRAGYSSIGPGRLTVNKPDISGYTHFRGSGVYSADGGTSAATPVVAGVIAAVRSKRPYDPGNPATLPTAIRSLVTSTAEDLGTAGYDFEHGFGVVNGCELARRFTPVTPIPDIFDRYPWLRDFCKQNPHLCNLVPILPPIPVPPRPFGESVSGGYFQPAEAQDSSFGGAQMPRAEMYDPAEIGYLAGYHAGVLAQSSTTKSGGKDCSCRDE
jgi:subtilisin family serine protease